MNDYETIKQRYEDAKAVRSQYEGTLAMLGKYNWPQMQDVVIDKKMDDGNVVKTVDVYNSTAALASDVMANGILANMMPIGLKWFEFAPEDEELNEDYGIRLELSKRAMNTHRALFSSNFLSKMVLLFRSIVVYSFGCIGKKKTDKGYHFTFYSIKEFLYEKNSDGVVDTVFRIMSYNARQAKQEFGNTDLGDKVKKAMETNSKTKFTFVHAVFPNADYDGKFGSKKFASKILNLEDDMFIESDKYKNGYDNIPYKVAFFGESQDGNIGSSPSIDALPSVKMLDTASKDFIEACEINSFPPTMIEDDGVIGQPNTGPRGLIVIRAGAMEPKPLKTGANPQLNAEFIAQEEVKVKQAYKNDVFDSMNFYRSMSASEFKQIEIEKKIEEGFMSLAPLTASIQSDFMSPLILEVDEELNGKSSIPMKIIYHGRLHIALNAMQTNATETHLAKWAPFEESNKVFDNIDLDKAFKISGINSGVPAEYFREEKDVNMIRQERNAPAQAMADAEIASTAAQAYKQVADANK